MFGNTGNPDAFLRKDQYLDCFEVGDKVSFQRISRDEFDRLEGRESDV